jgi:trimeric autotransporter adhesin
MLNTKQKLKIPGAFVTLLFLAAVVGCNGFFVNPTLSSITVTPPSPSLTAVGQTQQLTATGTYSDGTTQNLTAASGTTWSSSDTAAVTVNKTGLIKAISLTAASSVTITVTNTTSAGAVSGTATVCVGSTCTTSGTVAISPDTTSYSLSGVGGVGQPIDFTASVSGSTVSATWSSSNTSVINFTDATTGVAAFEGQGTTTITASTTSGTGSLTINVGP